MADIIIKNLGELKDVVIENLKEGTILSIDISGKEATGDDESDGKQ